jgi:hypothetical protein
VLFSRCKKQRVLSGSLPFYMYPTKLSLLWLLF